LPHEAQAWFARNHAAHVLGSALAIENRQLNEIEAAIEARAPDHVARLYQRAIVETGNAVPFTYDALGALDPEFLQLFRSLTDQGPAVN
jgi:hypothetical protein